MNFIITNELHISVADYTGKSRDLNPAPEKLLSYVRIIELTSSKLIRFFKAKYCHLSLRRNPLRFCFRAAAGFYLHFGV